MTANELTAHSKQLNEAADLYKDLAHGDPYALKRFEALNLDMKAIKTAIDFLTKRDNLSDTEKATLLSEPWRINFRDRPPTLEEFVTEKYLGATAPTLYPYVIDVFKEFMDPTNGKRDLILYPAIGWGKQVAYGEKIYTPKGYILAENIQVGDQVCTPDGKASQVINMQDYPEEPIYEVEFLDGRTARVGGPHFWKAFKSYSDKVSYNRIQLADGQVKYRKIHVKGTRLPDWKLITTEKILEDLEQHPKHRWYIPLPEQPVFHTGHQHQISPYTLGAYLGDGCFRGSSPYRLTGNDPEVFERVAAEQPDNFKFQAVSSSVKYLGKLYKVSAELRRLGLLAKDSFEKFIPEEYLYDSPENRIALLQGLMDTDGYAGRRKANNGVITEFCTVSSRLKEDFQQLVRGLGGVSRVYLDKRKQGAYWIQFFFPYNLFPIFSLARKQQVIDQYYQRDLQPHQKLRSKYLRIKQIRRLPQKGGRCIETSDAERLFLIGDYVVTHNSFLSTIISLYIITCCSLMRDPYKFFGLSPATVLCQMLVSYSLKKSRELLVKPFENIMESSPFFQKVQRKDTMKVYREEFEQKEHVNCLYYTTADPDSDFLFDSGITVKTTSNPQGLLGLSIISCVMSELAFFTDAGKSPEFIMRIYNDAKQRVFSRMKGNYYGRTILDTSPNSLTNPIDDYIVNDAPKNPKNMIISGSVWKWRPYETPDGWDLSYGEQLAQGRLFKVYTGGKGQPAKILDPDDPILTDPKIDRTKIIDVPESFRQAFTDDLGKSLKDSAGIPTGVADSIITDFQIIEDMFDNNLRNIYTYIYAPATESPTHLIWDQIKDKFFRNVAGQYEFYYLPHIARCISIDQSEATDVTSIAMGHVERNMDSGDIIFIIDFTITIVPTPARINLEAIACFIKDLQTEGHIMVEAVSFDSFQSAPSIQSLKRDGFDVVKLSVDKTTGPYLNLISAMNQRRVHVGKNIFLKNNLKSLHATHRGKTDKLVIDHDASSPQVVTGDETWESSFIGYYGKDCSDSVAAVVELCTQRFPVAQVNYEGGPKAQGQTWQTEKSQAVDQTKKLISSLGFRI